MRPLCLCLITFTLIKYAEPLQCHSMNTIQGMVQQCPAHIMSCMKFVCSIRGYDQVFKGCNDPASPPVACQTLQANCQAQGGTGQCYTCSYEFCNFSANLWPFAMLLSIALYSF